MSSCNLAEALFLAPMKVYLQGGGQLKRKGAGAKISSCAGIWLQGISV